MVKKCPECGTVLPIGGASSCSECGLLLEEGLNDSGAISEEQEKRFVQGVSDRLARNNRFLWKVSWRTLTWFFSLLGLAFGWGIWSAVEKLNTLATRRFDALDRNMSNLVVEANVRIATNIASQFEEPRIRRMVEDVADKKAKAMLEAEVRPTVDRFRADAEFLRLATRARAYDFKAYLQLLELKKNTNDLARFAEAVLVETDRSLERERLSPAHRIYMRYSGTNTYQGPFTSDELAAQFESFKEEKVGYNREGIVNTLSEFKQPRFLPSLMEFLTNETDLAVADRLTIAISELGKEDFHPHDFERIQAWWNLHKAEYTNWPFSEFRQGWEEFGRVHYAEAAKSFEEVVNLDPAADMSRALAIGCRLEMGDTNKAVELGKGFKSPTGPWAEWAAIKTELETGSVSNATVRLARLVRTNPTFEFAPTEGMHFWRKIDWRLVRKLNSTGD